MAFKIEIFLAVTHTIGFFGILTLLFFVSPSENETVVTSLVMLLGILAGSLKAIISFYFGSSTGSKSKDEAMLRGR